MKKFGILEYWIMDPDEEINLNYVLEDERYKIAGKFDESSKFTKINTIDIEISIEKIFKSLFMFLTVRKQSTP